MTEFQAKYYANGNGNGKKNGHKSADAQLLESYVFGRVQPQAVELEQAVLGAIMLNREALPLVMDILKPESFYLESHQIIYRACLYLFGQTYPVDLLTVTEHLHKSGDLEKVGGGHYLTELSHRVASAANIEYHARIVHQKWIGRQLIEISTATIRDAYEDSQDVLNLLETHEKGLMNIVQGHASKGARAAKGVMQDSIRKIERARKSEGLTGVPSGFTSLDRFTGGWQAGDLIILAARPGMGKTALLVQMLTNAAADFDRPVALFSLEMPDVQILDRIISLKTGIDLHRLRRGDVTDAEMDEVYKLGDVFDASIFVDETPGLTLFEVRARARRLKMQHDIQMVVIDYLQLMSGGEGAKGNREQEIASITRGLKSLAKELGVPVIALSQLSRAVEVRGGSKRPQLSDLRESGSIEQEADAVVFIYRPAYYKILENEDGSDCSKSAELIFAKHRNGPVDTVDLKFDDTCARFYEDDFSDQFPATPPPFSPALPSGAGRNEDLPF